MPRRIVICADGTWNTADQKDDEQTGAPTPTNVTKMARAVCSIAPDGTSQIVYYHEGVGTRRGIDRLTGGAFGDGIDRNITDCYRFLVDNYAEGDEIYLFGFSRGAYTVRSLAGLIRNVGLLHPTQSHLIPRAYEIYRHRDDAFHPKGSEAVRFRERHAREVRIHCIGVWDTVGALGVPLRVLQLLRSSRYNFHDVELSSWVENAFHALAIDERRRPFEPTLWGKQVDAPATQRLEQVWFAGVHSNVGGGYPDCGLSDTAFLWMAERARECGLELEEEYLRGIRASHAGAARESMNALYWFLGPGPQVRRLGRPVHDRKGRRLETNESVHPSVLERMALKDPPGPYAPGNLQTFLGSQRERPVPAGRGQG